MVAGARELPAVRTPVLRRVMPASMFARELLVTITRPRSLLIKIAFPLILTVPLITGHAPTFWAAMLLSVLCAMVGTIGSAVTLSRAREAGLLTRLALTPRSPARVLAAWIAGATAVDALQLAPAIAVLLILAPVTLQAGIALVLVICAVLLLANVLGCLVSAVGGGPGEVLLDVSVLLAPLLFLGGLFTGVPRDGWRWYAAIVDPFSYLHSAFIDALGGAPAFGAGVVAAAAVVTAVVALAVLTLAAPFIVRR